MWQSGRKAVDIRHDVGVAWSSFGSLICATEHHSRELSPQYISLGFSMHFYDGERIVLFIDGAQLFATANSLDFDIDYKLLLGLFRQKGHLVRALYYTALVAEQEYNSLRPLIDWLDYNGFTMVTKLAKEFTDVSGRHKIKVNMNIELAVDAMRLADTIDHIVIFSGDGDFCSLVAALQEKGKRVSIVSTLKTQPPMIADDLRRQADQFIDLADLESQIERNKHTGIGDASKP